MIPNQHTKLELIQAQVTFIPDGWKLDKVGNALAIRNNFRKPISQEVRSTMQGKYPYYGPTKIQDYIAGYEQDGIYALIGEDGDHFLKYSTMRQTQFISGKCTVNNHAHILESSDECDSEWFYTFFMHRNITNFLSRQGAGRFKLNKATLEKLPLLVPPLPEQRKIATILGTWDKAISTTERLIDNSKQQKKSLMQQLLTGAHKGKRLLDDSGKPFEGEWKRVELGKLLDYKQPTPYLVKSTEYSNEYPTPVLTAGKTFILGYSNEDFGIFKEELPAIIFDDFTTASKFVDFPFKAKSSAMKILVAKDGVSIKYIYEAMQVLNYPIGGHQRHWISIFANLVIGLPSPEEQQKIAAVLTNADKEVELLEQQLADLKQEKKALMQQLLTGKRRVIV
jgi:type I restriction enzyme S subunit